MRSGNPLRRRAAPVTGWLVAGAVALAACLSPPLELGGGRAVPDAASDASVLVPDSGAAALIGQFSINGCAELHFTDSSPRCTGTAPLSVELVLLEVGASSHHFQLTGSSEPSDGGSDDGGAGTGNLLDETKSRARAPRITLERPGTYQVSLGVAGPGGTASATGVIVVQAAPVGASCARDVSCQGGLRCVCGSGAAGRDGLCPGGLAAGFCTQSCDGTACPDGSVCMDVSRSLPAVGPGSTDTWRHPICVPGCSVATADMGTGTGSGSTAGCGAGLSCRDLPLLLPGGRQGGPFTWGRGCFTATPSAVGGSCLGGDDKPDGTACAVGLCEPLGGRGVCSAACSPACPSGAACATWNSKTAPAPPDARCLQRCDAMHPCQDPLLDCLPGGGSGTLGFKLMSEPAGTLVCAPRRCTASADCKGGRCQALGGALFCVRS